MTSTEKMINAVVASGEVGNTRVDPDPANQPYTRALAESIVKHQQECIVCGNGMIVLPWGQMVPINDRIALLAATPNGDKGAHIHRNCLYEPSAGAAIAVAISTAERPCTYDTCGRESVGTIRTASGGTHGRPGTWVTSAICQRHLDGVGTDTPDFTPYATAAAK